MAVWQFDILLVPDEVAASSPLIVGEESVDASRWWQSRQPPPDLPQRLDSLLPRCRSWSDDIWEWGEEEGTCIQIFTTDGVVEEIHVRLDLRSPIGRYVDGVIDLAVHLRCRLCLMEGPVVIEADQQRLLQQLQRSSACRFVRDPMGYLRSIASRADSSTD